AVNHPHLIQQNLPQVQSIKDPVLKQIHFYPKPSAIIPSTTSPIIPTHLQNNLKHPQRLLLTHPFHPLYILPLVQILP
ncbi:3-hydroxyacyl-CoA dehydrogenase NAD-binding domain-containing protein, partial [Staphylococcus hominis]|uniref:3-hydroxyacyl-CoA dehydrogenase NAD-binding domain-containing protein n=1 Tax=Staphylococcus hominis TaxID=1290 RepID=UPI0021B23665